MKIELSEADFEALAASLERRITERVIRGIVAGGVNDLISNAVKTVAAEYWSMNCHKFSAEDDETAKLLMKELDTISSERNAEMEKLKRKFSRKISKFETKMKGISK